jgi:hypothetical protein
LALSSEVKVGVTRNTQVPTDGLIKARSDYFDSWFNRYLAGITEVALKDHYADKTIGVNVDKILLST